MTNAKTSPLNIIIWEDRYHATAIDTDRYLAKCMVYIDLNMVRAGVVSHPSEYNVCGYNEIQDPPKRYSIINRRKLMDCFSMQDDRRFCAEYRNWVIAGLQNDALAKDSNWSGAIAMGRQVFVTEIQQQLASRALKRSIVPVRDSIIALKEPEVSYSTVSDAEKHVLSSKNTYIWKTNV